MIVGITLGIFKYDQANMSIYSLNRVFYVVTYTEHATPKNISSTMLGFVEIPTLMVGKIFNMLPSLKA